MSDEARFALVAGSALLLVFLCMTYAARVFATSPSEVARKSVAWCCAAISAFTAMALVMSAIYKGPAARYDPDGWAVVIRNWIVVPGNFAALLLPVAIAVLLVSLRKPRRAPSFLALAVTAIVSVPIALVLAIVIGCNHAGACL
jgi:hypothetical protein